jgi:hypothetical protein
MNNAWANANSAIMVEEQVWVSAKFSMTSIAEHESHAVSAASRPE